MISWRIIFSPPSSGSWNMAVDEVILEKVVTREVPPTLRFYRWDPYCLSIGHAQKISEVNMDFLNKMGWGMVRRPTGGRAILHAEELTYSVNAPLDNPYIHGGVIESYQLLSHCLLHALDLIGIKTDSKPKVEEEKRFSKNPVCFQISRIHYGSMRSYIPLYLIYRQLQSKTDQDRRIELIVL